MAKDPSFSNFNIQDTSAVIGLASPKDRLAAYILDCVLLLPVVQLIQSPVKRAILEAMLYEQSDVASYFRYFNLFLFIVLFVFYYTLMIWWRGQTFGKMFFSVKVISYQGHLTIYQSFLRSLSIFLEMLCFGYPFLAILDHSLRRPIHDRVGDTLVISLKTPVGFPSQREKLQSRVLASLMSFALVLTALSYLYTGEFSGAGSDLVAMEKSCDDYKKQSQLDLENFVELYLTRKIDEDCLCSQAREALWKEKDGSLAQLAMALAKKNDPEISEKYLKHLCEKNQKDRLCLFSQWLEGGEKAKGVSEELEMKMDELPVFARIYIAIDLEKQKKYQSSLSLINGIYQNHEMADVMASLAFSNLLALLQWDEAYWVFKTSKDVDDQDFLYFIQREMKTPVMSNQEKIQLIELFYPQILQQDLGRQPASVGPVPEEVADIYKLLQGEL